MRLSRLLQRLSPGANACELGPAPVGDLAEIAFSSALANWIQKASECMPGAPALTDGAVTATFWRALLPDTPLPSLLARSEAMTLTFEATPFSTPPLWNFCQDIDAPPEQRPRLVKGGAACVNRSDPCSMLTWGPRGATAGQGREIQWILKRLDRDRPALLTRAFGTEALQMRRFLKLEPAPVTSCDGSSASEAFLCAVWLAPERRNAWTSALHQLGGSEEARRVYNEVYALFEFDGYKLAEYRDLWARLGLQTTELDFAFFYDRATHIGSPPAPIEDFEAQLSACMSEETAAFTRNAAARRCVGRLHIHDGTPVDRLGRDMAYYRSSYPEDALTQKERDTWDRHIPIDGDLNLGLSDDRLAPDDVFRAAYAAPEDWPRGVDTTLTEEERQCQALIWGQRRAQ